MVQPSDEPINLDNLKSCLKAITKWPVDAKALIKHAKTAKPDRTVVEFLESLPETSKFKNAENILTRAEEVNLLRQEHAKAPPEDYIIDEY